MVGDMRESSEPKLTPLERMTKEELLSLKIGNERYEGQLFTLERKEAQRIFGKNSQPGYYFVSTEGKYFQLFKKELSVNESEKLVTVGDSNELQSI